MKTLILFFTVLLLGECTQGFSKSVTKKELKTKLTKAELQDKIKGGWAGQVIGCTFGGPTEFRYNGTMINDYQPIPWDENRCLWYYKNSPGLYDDVYMDLTFVEVFEKEGLDAPAASHALAFAHADYRLWHANQAARYNILNGIMPPESGYWENNPHADDIDFQIEADFAGLMAPGMVNTASEICDKVGHIMNYGDGWYGGVYVAGMYSLAFVLNDVNYIVTEALKAIPEESQFYQCIHDVIQWHNEYPNDWKQTWFEVERKWSADIGCPDGVFRNFNIDAKINAAYIVIGLLYGEGDYSKTLEISTRCGQDSDCNPASAGGILGTMLGYSEIPEFWKRGVYPVESMDFKYTTMSLNDVYEIGLKHALQVISENGGKVKGENITLAVQEIQAVAMEVGFENHFPVERNGIGERLTKDNSEFEVEFTGNGFVLTGSAQKQNEYEDLNLELEMSIDGGESESFLMPTGFAKRRHEVAWKYQLPEGKHVVKISLKNPVDGYAVNVNDLLVYSSVKIENTWKTN
ncbi:ADP-ribosylglycohydrolase family protein [Maribellus maritimus]|uniref:ADP-ribosylglycohydrolase family protein n=1 Tax=Maribellus maritimus TaxID=2870838 RepID=UPI001EEC84F1|nr:ADP-ribosylglycohydrolase family protein [Maribellus maritimus]MCG6188574.1 ADP-ribosylglycohydrolase family protein [Maribellus maritimus]